MTGTSPTGATGASPTGTSNASGGTADGRHSLPFLREVGPGLHVVSDGLYQALVLDTGTGTAVFDAPPSLAALLPDAVAAAGSGPVTHLVYSHAHGDHVGAARVFAADQPIVVAHERTAELLARTPDAGRLAVTRTFTETLILDLGRHEARLAYHGPNHSPDNVFIHLPAQRTLMLVDVVFPGTAPYRELTVATDIPGLFTAHDRLLEYDFDILIGGHFTRLGTRADVEVAREFLLDLFAVTRDAVTAVDPRAVAAELGPQLIDHPYSVARAVDERIAARGRAALLPRWKERLEGLEVFLDSQLAAAAGSLRWDYNYPASAAAAPPETETAT